MENFNCQNVWQGSILCFILLMIATVYSCSKSDEINLVPDPENSNLPISQRTSPATISDRVYFADYDEFKDYYLELENLLMTNNTDYFDSIVDVNTSVQTLNDVVMATVGSFGPISDPVMRSIINANNEFQIDDILVTLISDGQWLLSDVSDGTLKTTIRGITKGNPISLNSIPAGAYWVSPSDLEDGLLKFWCGCRVSIEQLNCDEIRVYGFCSGFFNTQGVGDLTVTFAPGTILFPGTPTTIHTEENVSNFDVIINISTFNLQEGLVHASADSPCWFENSPATADYWFHPDDFMNCDGKERSVKETITSSDDNERMIIQTSFNKGISDNHNAEIICETKINGEWKRRKADLTVSVFANRKDFDCEFLADNDDEESGFWRHRVVRVAWYANCWHCDGDLVGRFEKVKGGFTLTATQDIDFHCCEQ